MKNLKQILVVLLLATTLVSSAQKKKVAVVTFYADKMVDVSELGGLATIIKEVTNLRDDPNFNLTPTLEKFHNDFFNEYSKQFPFELMPEQEVLTNPNYISFEPKYEDKYFDRNYLLYPNYKYIYEGFAGKYNEEGIAKALGDKVDGVLFVNLNFAFQKGFGIGGTSTLKVRATARLALYNKKGEKVFAFFEGEDSKKTAIMVGGIPVISAEKVLPMCNSAMEELMGDLQKRIAKIVKKSEMKL
ncbi:MAG: hypothetical protein O9267_02750 [Flavobacterium sp.]|uniref:hypothetical protein n=1 Tax=Flavobacterium sp. TaxID=239 RepID=UPI0022C6598F|nr:hypothetical protein [Flavobacterium sp.]MCZ8196512.1 hypothetical protein [Flavobacterium sp.]